MKIIKRNGTEVVFDIEKINKAISKANNAVEEKVRLTPVQISRIAESVTVSCEEMGRSPSVEEIQDLVEKSIMAHGAFEVAKEYITYRYTRNLARQSNTTRFSCQVTKKSTRLSPWQPMALYTFTAVSRTLSATSSGMRAGT